MLGFAVSTRSSGIITTAAPFASPSLPGPDAQKCAALKEFNLESALGGPAVITSAHLVEVSANGLEALSFIPADMVRAVLSP